MNTPIYKVHVIDLRTGRNFLIFKSEDENEARKFFDNEKVTTGREKHLSVVYLDSVTLIDYK